MSDKLIQTETTASTTPPNVIREENFSGVEIAITPGQLRVIKRNGKITSFDESKISVAITKAFLAVEGGNAAASSRIVETVNRLTKNIMQVFWRRAPSDGTLHIEDVQDQVELALMREGLQKVARAYVLYREERRREREAALVTQGDQQHMLHVSMPDGRLVSLQQTELHSMIQHACEGLNEVSAADIYAETERNIFEGISLNDVYKAAIMSARTMIEKEPNYSFVTARLLLRDLYTESLGFLEISHDGRLNTAKDLYPVAFTAYLKRASYWMENYSHLIWIVWLMHCYLSVISSSPT
jgi:ribonucleoside-diphosphate reductase alpha chain